MRKQQQAATLLLSVWLWSGNGVAWAREAPAVPAGVELLGDDQSRPQAPVDGQPRVGFAGARLYLRSPPGKTLTWRSDLPARAEISTTSGVAIFHQPGPVTFTATSADGQPVLRYTVSPRTWLVYDNNDTLRTREQAQAWCAGQGMRLPDATVLTGAGPDSLYGEWGDMTFARDEGGYGWPRGLYWTATPAGDRKGVAVDLMTGTRLHQSVHLAFRTVCQAPVPPSPGTWLQAAVPQGQPEQNGWARGEWITGFEGARITMKLAEAGTTQPPVWQSSSPSVATVDNQGVVTLWGPGRTEIEVRDPQSGGYDRWPLLVSGWVSQGAEGWAGNKAPDTVCPPESTLLDRGRWDALDAQWGTDLQTAIMGHHPAIRVQGTITENTTSEEAPLLRIRDGQELPAKGRAVAACLRMVVPPVLTGWSVGNFQWPIAQGGPRNGFRGARFRLRLAEPPGGLTWRSDKPEVASVDDIGQVTLHQLGETVIRAGNAAGEASLALAVQTWWSALPVRPEGYTWDEAAQQCQAQGGTLPTLAQLIGEKADRAPVPASWWGEWPSVRAAADDLDLLWSATSRSRTSGAHAVVRLRDGTTGEMSDNLRAGGWCVMPSPPRKAP